MHFSAGIFVTGGMAFIGIFWEIYACSGLESLWGRNLEVCREGRQTEHPLCSICPCSALCSAVPDRAHDGEAAGARERSSGH